MATAPKAKQSSLRQATETATTPWSRVFWFHTLTLQVRERPREGESFVVYSQAQEQLGLEIKWLNTEAGGQNPPN